MGAVATLDKVIEQFTQLGMPPLPSGLKTDTGRWTRYGKGQKAYYKISTYQTKDGRTLYYGTFGQGGEGPWKIESDENELALTQAEWAEIQRKQAEADQRERERRERAAGLAANRARDQWNKAAKAGQSPYLERKRIGRHESVRFMDNGQIIIPLIRYDRNALVGAQKIAATGEKRFNAGMEKEGAACRLGEEPTDGDLLLLAEGFSTAASAREGVGFIHPVYAAIDAGNLMQVAKILRSKYPHSPILFLADDDYAPASGHVGRIKAEKAAAAVGNASVVLPQFSVPRGVDKHDETAPYLTDFNDLHVAEGIAPVIEQLAAAVASLASPAPSQADDVVEPPAVATAKVPGGAGEEAGAEDVAAIKAGTLYRHYALIDNRNKAFDHRSQEECPMAALRARFGKTIVDAWLDRDDKLLITQAEVSVAKKLKAEREKKTDVQFLHHMQRYVFLDGSTSIWDRTLHEMIPQGAAKLAMGSYFDVWVDSPERKVIPLSNVRFAPGRELDEENYINLFCGMDMQPDYPMDRAQLPRKLWELVGLFPKCQHIIALAYHLCDGRNDVFEWLLNWIAYPLQHVGAKMDSAILMHGSVHGSGKSMFFEKCVKPLYGRYSITLGQDQLESQYTGSRSARLFLLFEEVFSSKQRYSQTGKVKHMITGLTQVIEKKFMNAWEESNHANCVFLSNAIQPIHVEAYDRRFQVIWPTDTADEDIYRDVDHEISEGGLEAFLALLLALPLTLTQGREQAEKFDAHTKPLMTDEKKRLISYGLSGWELFVFQWENGEIDGVPFVSCLTEDLYAVYKLWCDREGESPISANKFSCNVSVFDMKKLTKKLGRWRWGGMAAPQQNTLFKVGREESGTPEMDYLGKQISIFKDAARKYGVHLRGDM